MRQHERGFGEEAISNFNGNNGEILTQTLEEKK